MFLFWEHDLSLEKCVKSIEEKLFCIAPRNFCVCAQTFCIPLISFALFYKTFAFHQKICIHLQTFYNPLRNPTPTHKSFAFPPKMFLQESLGWLAKGLYSPVKLCIHTQDLHCTRKLFPAGTGYQCIVRLTHCRAWCCIFGWEWKSGWRQYLMPIWLNIGFWLYNLNTTHINISWHRYWHQINTDVRHWLDIEFWSPNDTPEI